MCQSGKAKQCCNNHQSQEFRGLIYNQCFIFSVHLESWVEGGEAILGHVASLVTEQQMRTPEGDSLVFKSCTQNPMAKISHMILPKGTRTRRCGGAPTDVCAAGGDHRVKQTT